MPVSRMALRYTLRIPFVIALSTLAVLAGAAVPQPDAVRSAIFVLGPAAGNPGLQAARSAAFACRRWLKEPGASAELRRAGSSESVALDKIASKDLESAFLTAARDASDRDPADLISTLDDAVHALANRPGLRVAVAIVDAAPLSSETQESLRQIIQYSSSNSVHIVLLDPSKASAETAGEIWELAGSTTSGAFIQESRTLASTLLSVSGVQPTAADAEPALPERAAPSASSNLSADLPVYVRFIQISNRSTSTQSQLAALSIGPTGGVNGANVGEAASRVEGAGGPLHGYLIVQAPLSALHFDKDDRTGAYSGHAVVNVTVRSDSGKTAGKAVWHAAKDVKINGPLAKFHDREGGNLYFLREVQLQGGKFTLEASVEDVLANKTANISEPLKTGSSVPGLMVSDAMFVKSLKGSVDKFEADTTLNYQGNAIAPLLGPVFPADTPFKVELYFILYPDIYGPQPGITLEILQGGKVVSQASMPFKSMLQSSGQEIKGSAITGELQHGFDYIASMNVDKMSASDCQARLTIRQGGNVVTRVVDFRVAEKSN
ncbi:MAG: hypothetical protein ABSH47_21775 [Bryobacteraceae bacterium]